MREREERREKGKIKRKKEKEGRKEGEKERRNVTPFGLIGLYLSSLQHYFHKQAREMS